MQNFVFHQPTKILFGRETISSIGSESIVFGTRALLVYGSGSIRENGIYDRVMASLTEAGLEVIEYPGVRSNPVLSHVREGIRVAKEHRIEVVIAVGGGSVIDSAKAIAAGALVNHDVWLFFKGKKSVAGKLPLTCVLTLAAAGSEMNGGMVLTNDDLRQKFGTGNQHLKPQVSILDPEATFSVPLDYSVYGAVDAIAHILEFYFTTGDPTTPVQDRLMEGLVLNIMEACERILVDPKDYNARADLMWCATLALNGLTGAGLGPVGFPMHMIEHSLSALFDVPHGAGLSVVIPAWMTWRNEQNPLKFAQFARRVFGVLESDDRLAANQGIHSLKSWFKKVKSPVFLEDLDIAPSAIDDLAANAMDLARLWRLREYDQGIISRILQGCRRSGLR
ncbi:MAG: iron-containing alcohol dehydrogenase [Proteobacteria bacterium]|nr:iron-containing alcohol dehydrogenase [Pseudomonadota bacterium]MBU1686506.1 iron-containing alcohol dehydrogenase [Pseudomonadota bacterium]